MTINDARTYTLKFTVKVDPAKMGPFGNELSKDDYGPTFGNITNRIEFTLTRALEELVRDHDVINSIVIESGFQASIGRKQVVKIGNGYMDNLLDVNDPGGIITSL